MNFDIAKQNEPKYLKKWYESRIKFWSASLYGKKIVKKYNQAIINLNL